MSYNRENFIRVRREFEKKAAQDREDADRRRAEIHEKFPEVKSIDDELLRLQSDIVGAVIRGGNVSGTAEKLREQAASLRAARAGILKSGGYPEDYTQIRYECAKCRDTGFDGIKVCSCMKKRLILAEYESSGIGRLMETQSFDTFDLSYYRVSDNMAVVLKACREYAENFDTKTSPNLLFIGKTGLGKTHLSTSIARVVIDRSYDVRYETAQNLFSDFEYERFGRQPADEIGKKTDSYFDCELLIIDDLGTEMTNSFTVSCLYNLINTRVNCGRPMIINTNLEADELNRRYSDRITSRLLGGFSIMRFTGTDIRQQKLLKKTK